MMNNPNAEAQDRRTPYADPKSGQLAQRYKFTPDEVRVLNECAKESFLYRCLPFSAIFGSLTYYGIHTGMFKPNPRFGASPKVAAATVLGYVLGKISYHQTCAEKFMQLPDSKVGRVLKARRLGKPDKEQESEIGNVGNFAMNPFAGLSDNSSNKENDEYGSTPTPEGLDDAFRPSLDNPIRLHEEEMPPEQKHVTTYEELRLKNRTDFENKRFQAYRSINTPSIGSSIPSSPSGAEFNDDYKSAGPKNKYGDKWG